MGEGPPAEFDAYFERGMDFGFYFKFAASFWPHRNDKDVLWLRYEDLQRDLRGETERIVRFLGWDVTGDDIDRVLPLVDFKQMRAKEKTEIFKNADKSWKEDGYFFREGGVGKNRARLSADQERRILERMRAELPDACDFLLGLG